MNSVASEINSGAENTNPEPDETPLIIFDREATVVYANPAFCNLIGYDCGEIIGQNISIIRSPSVPAEFYEEIRSSINAGKEWKGKVIDRRKDGKLVEMLTKITPIKNKAGEITHFIGIKENSIEKIRHAVREEEIQKLSQLGRISGSLLHELKSHYALIKMNMDQFEPKSEAEKNNYIIIKKDLEKLNRYFQNVLQYLRNKEYDMTKVNLHNVINNSYSFIKPLILGKEIQFNNRVADEIIKADYQQLQSVFKNLIENAVDSIENEGSIETWSERVNGFIKVYLKDNGTGMSNPERAFEPFYSTKTSGSGLGLAISEKIMNKHNGSLKLLKSQKGETIFEMNFPRMDHEQNSDN